MGHQIPAEVASDIGPLLDQLAELGYQPTDSRYSPESFGNYFVDLVSRDSVLRIVRDRSQYFIESALSEELRQAGMFRAFDDRTTFGNALLGWLRGRAVPKTSASEVISLEGPVNLYRGELTLRIPLVAGGERLLPYVTGIGVVEGDYLNIVIKSWLAEKLGLVHGSRVAIDNSNGKFNITPIAVSGESDA